MKKRVTMTMIAEKCGTSIGTVDRALNGRTDINPETREHILNTARELGYKSSKAAKNLRIAFIYPDAPEEFYSCIRLGVERAAEELAFRAVEIDTLNFSNADPSTQIDLLNGLVTERYDVFAINSIIIDCSCYIDELAATGKPVVLFNNDLPSSARTFYVGSNSLQSGRMGGELLGLLMGGEGGVAVLGNFVHIVPFIERFDGFCQVMHQLYPAVSIYSCADCRLDMELTKKNIENLLSQIPDLKAIFCTGYSNTVHAIRALEALGREDILLVGYDVGSETANAVKTGVCKALLYQDPYQQGYQTARLLCRYLLDGWKPQQSQLFIETRVVFRQNIENYTGGMTSLDQSI